MGPRVRRRVGRRVGPRVGRRVGPRSCRRGGFEGNAGDLSLASWRGRRSEPAPCRTWRPPGPGQPGRGETRSFAELNWQRHAPCRDTGTGTIVCFVRRTVQCNSDVGRTFRNDKLFWKPGVGRRRPSSDHPGVDDEACQMPCLVVLEDGCDRAVRSLPLTSNSSITADADAMAVSWPTVGAQLQQRQQTSQQTPRSSVVSRQSSVVSRQSSVVRHKRLQDLQALERARARLRVLPDALLVQVHDGLRAVLRRLERAHVAPVRRFSRANLPQDHA